MANLNKTKLDAVQCTVGAYDGIEEAQRVIIAAATEFAIELSAADGDSVLTIPNVSASSTATIQTPASVSGDILLTLTNAGNYSKCQIYTESLSGVSGSGSVNIQASPDDSGTLWATLGSAITSPSSPGTSASSIIEFVAKRLRIASGAAPAGGNVRYKIILKS
jgi:hypothetical protein